MIIDHIGLAVSDIDQAKTFFSKALAPLRIKLLRDNAEWVGFGRDGGRPQFWFGTGLPSQRAMHIAFAAESREQVRAFHAAALAAGATDNGPPGIRSHYHPGYYGAFVIGPDGHNIEAACHRASD